MSILVGSDRQRTSATLFDSIFGNRPGGRSAEFSPLVEAEAVGGSRRLGGEKRRLFVLCTDFVLYSLAAAATFSFAELSLFDLKFDGKISTIR